ncbi:PolC-type DNA polymerase III [Mesomycoplasma lagogenitalium]|uniref:DNA polymerase III PolC-type n=1 Tax=Mesomycoplasma lagogenitalium TaxID=171286 RepID=A0ABY8LT19_9BACT|nr:PolC-type DNA polymerase III [Mesomycoplasma lagogenitalium]WGI36383.1 PolC-type DNA polymerase III [Mesomycoplasma lagogenitalium]
MDVTFKKFCDEINFQANKDFHRISVEKVEHNKQNDCYFVYLNFNEVLEIDNFKNFYKKVKEAKLNFDIIINYFDNSKIEFLINKYFDYAYFLTTNFKNFLHNKKIEYKNNVFTINFSNEIEKNNYLENCQKTCDILKKWGFSSQKIEFKLNSELENEIIKKREQEAIIEQQKWANEVSDNLKKNNGEFENYRKSFDSFKKNKSYIEMSIKEAISTEEFNIIVSGEIFKRDITKTKTGLLITILTITDYEEAIKIKIFSKTDSEKNEQEKFTIGTVISVQGNCIKDEYLRSKVINAKTITILDIKRETRKDDEKVKRVELYARSNMSAMDGIASAQDYVKAAKSFNHNAVGIADLDSVQSFPDFYHSAKKEKIKAIYGSTFNAIDFKNDAVLNLINENVTLKNASYVVFDLETTGLSPRFDQIIEFGASFIKNGKIEKSVQFFVRPDKPLPKHIIEITKITEEDVKNAISEKEAIEKIYEILDNNIAVAHNANFDIGFVNEKLYKYNFKKLNISTIDSLVVARMLNPESKKFRLENLATRVGVIYDSSVAHRADYDADVLAKVWINFLSELEKKNILTLGQLENYNEPSLHAKKFSDEIVVYAKNQQGLKELFKLISFASTENFHGGPKLFFDKLQKSENILISTGTLNSRLIKKLIYSTTESLYQELDKYDFIMIPPLRDFAHLINRNEIEQNDLVWALKDLVYKAKEKNIPVVAVSDCRYINEKEKIFHNIYINAKGLGGVRHYLYKYNEEDPIYPTQNFLTTKEMYREFNFLDDFELIKEIVVDNSNLIANLIEDNIEVIKSKLYAPIFDNSKENLEKLVYKTAKEKYGEILPEIVESRLKAELNPILNYGFDVVYWISHKLVAKSLNDGYLVGSRGSVGSSLVATMAGITEVNPLIPHYICKNCKKTEFFTDSQYQSGFDLPDKKCSNCHIFYDKDGQTIPFETFLGFKADKVPDIDLNFSGDYQMFVHDEVRKLFGEHHSFRAGTISTNAEKTVYGYVKSYLEETKKEFSPAFMEFLASKASGVKRTTGQHPGGIIIIPKEFDVEDFTPINFPANKDSSNWKTTHFDFNSIHDNVLKLDILGHDDPTAIKMLEELTNVKATDIPKSDPKIISLFSSTEALNIRPEDISGETTGAMGIPEFGTSFVRGMLKAAKVNSFADLVAISGLSHGTDVWRGNAEDLIVKEKLSFRDIVSCRDDIMVFLIRKGMDPLLAFKIMENVRKGKSLTPAEEEAAKSHDIPQWYIDSMKKIKYLFPKSHATAYVLMAWRIAYYKLYYPLAYYATYFTTRADVSEIKTLVAGKQVIKERISELKRREFTNKAEEELTVKEKDLITILSIAEEMYARGMIIQNINLNKSKANKWILDYETNSLIPPFSAIDGLGIVVANSIEQARDEKLFSSIEDLKSRTSLNKTLLEKMREMGILKNLNETDQNSLF